MAPEPRRALQQLYKWTRFLGIAGSMLAAFILLNGITALLNTQALEEAAGGAFGGIDFRAVAIGYIALGLLYIAPVRYLLRLSNQVEAFFKRDSAEDALNALMTISQFFRIVGVIALMIIGLFVLLLVGGVGAGTVAH